MEVTKEVMGWFEEKNNDDKEEVLEFGSSESGRVRMLRSFMGWQGDVEERLKRARKAWWVTKKRLRGAKISRRCQARIPSLPKGEAEFQSVTLLQRTR